MRKVDLKNAEPIDITKPVNIVTPMPEPMVVPDALLKAMGEPDATWIYRLPDGLAYGAVCRWNPEGKRKEIRPIVWNGKKHVTSGFGEGRPLYNSDLLAAAPVAPVLIVEGEKSADGAQAYMPDGWIVTTWQGGSKAIDQSDWSILAGHACVIWPDNDSPGIEAGERIRSILSKLGSPSRLVPIPASFEDGWDLADALPEKVTKSMVTQLLRRSLRDVDIMIEEEPEAEADMPVRPEFDAEGDDLDVASSMRYKPIGYDNQIYYLMNDEAEQIYGYTASRLMNEVGLTELVRDPDYWLDNQPMTKSKRVNFVAAGSMVMGQCIRAGVYDPERTRGRGVWIDKDIKGTERAVLHSGEQLFVSRENMVPREVPFVQVRSRYYYSRTRSMIADEGDGVDYLTPATDEDGLAIREMCGLVRWDQPIYADLMAGWIATAVICGALPWRTHCWVTGNQGSGKTTVVNEIAGAMLGHLALYPLGATTEAGIRQAVGNDARPIVFDEAEGDKNAAERREAIIQLMRQSSSETRGRIMKGSANHESKSFTMRSAFLMSSIGVGLKEAADLTRTAVLTIRPIESYGFSDLKRLEEQWHKFQHAASSMRRDMPQRLLARQMQNVWTLRKNVLTFREVIAGSFGNRRIGDQLGTLLAGAHSLSSTREITTGACEKYLERFDWSEFTSVKSVREDLALLHHICGSILRVETRSGNQERALGELLHQALYPYAEPDISPYKLSETLHRYGLKIDTAGSGVWIGVSVSTLNRLMSTSEYPDGWAKILMRNPLVKKSETPMRFGGQTSRAIFMPKAEWPISEGNAING